MFVAALLGSISFFLSSDPGISQPETEVAVMCFATGEQVSGMNKICYYDCLGSAKAITIKSFELCPLSIND